MSMNTYNIALKYEGREGGSEGRTIKVDATNIAGAVGKAVREFVKGLDRKQRFDANKGLHIEAVRVAGEAPAAEPGPESERQEPEKASEATA
jgi:hypothetical protein